MPAVKMPVQPLKLLDVPPPPEPRRCVHCRDWIAPQRLVIHPDAMECRECHRELKRGARGA